MCFKIKFQKINKYFLKKIFKICIAKKISTKKIFVRRTKQYLKWKIKPQNIFKLKDFKNKNHNLQIGLL